MPTLKLDHPHATTIKLPGGCLVPQGGAAVIDPRRAAAEALDAPLGFPPLSSAVVPGDRVAVALGESIPQLAAVAAGIADALHFAGVESFRTVLVTSNQADAALLEAARGDTLPTDIGVVRHDPTDENELCWAGVTRDDDQAVMINRALYEADLLLPVSCTRPPGDREHRGAYGGLYPAFSSAESMEEYRRTVSERHDWWSKRTDEVGWVLGAPLVVQVTPGEQGQVAAVAAGAPQEVCEEGQKTSRANWRRQPRLDADLVIATISGEGERQSWDDVARALLAAEAFTRPGAAVALCTSLRQPMGRSLARLRKEPDLETAARKLAKDAHADTWAAEQILRCLARGPLFLMSRLDPEAVEESGIGPIANGEELQRLADRFGAVAVLQDAQHVVIHEAGES
ncbi:MAG: hypothetical protein KDA37_13900 [Planctomycetales bacterium]|nr:hypothetical protein [Planctomycetales bacterium]